MQLDLRSDDVAKLQSDAARRVFEQQENDLGYVLGWLCGGIAILGLLVAIVNLSKGRRRKAFQAVVLPAIVIAWLFFCMDVLGGAEANDVAIVLLLVGIVFLPVLGLWALRRSDWPPRKVWTPA